MVSKKEKDLIKKAREREKLIKQIVQKYKFSITPEFAQSEQKGVQPYSLEYKIFKEEEKLARSLNRYERMCKSTSSVKIKPPEKLEEELKKAIDFLGLKVTPEETTALAVASFFLSFLIGLPFLFFPIPNAFKLLAIFLPFAVLYFMLYYPINKAAALRVKSGRDLVLAILYMIVYMKTTPNFEGAVRFAATNLEGKLALDLKEVLWKVETGQYTTVEDSLMAYLKKWKHYNKELIEAVHLIRQSMSEPVPERRDLLLNKAIDLVLTETDERMKRYARNLETPVMVLHGLGILLPVMGMVVFPLLSIFMGDSIKGLGIFLFVGYDIILPLGVYFLLNQIFVKRPPTYSNVDLRGHPDYVPVGKFRLKFMGREKVISAAVPALLIVMFTALPLLAYMRAVDFFYALSGTMGTMAVSVLFVFSIAVSLAVYYFLSSFQKKRLREELIEMENEFEEFMFALGNRLIDGLPVEVALRKAEEDVKELKIAEFIRILLKNMTQLSMTFKEALFDQQYGVLRYYPSALIRAIMKSMADAINKGSVAAAMVMLTISRYLRNIRTTQEKIEDLLSSIVSSLRFQAYVLIPAISGVVVGIAKIILRIIDAINQYFANLDVSGMEAAPINLQNFFAPGAMPSELLQIIVGIYVVEMLVLTGMFINRIEAGEDRIREHDIIWRLLLTGTIMYIIIFSLILLVFMPIINTALNF